MKRIGFWLFAIFLAAGSLPARASSRIDALGADINVVEDYDLIFTYPNKVMQYQRTVDYRLADLASGTSDDWAGYLHESMKIVGVTGFYLHRPNNDLFQNHSWTSLIQDNRPAQDIFNLEYDGFPYWYTNAYVFDRYNTNSYYVELRDLMMNVPSPNPLFDLFWGKTLGRTDVGVRLSYGDNRDKLTESSNDVNLQTSEGTARSYGIQAGLGLHDLGLFQEVNLSANYDFGTLYNANISNYSVLYRFWNEFPAQQVVRDSGIHAFGLNLNLRHDLDEDTEVRVYGSAGWQKFAIKGTDTSMIDYYPYNDPTMMSINNNYSMFQVGAGCDHRLFHGAALVAGGVKLESVYSDYTSHFQYWGDGNNFYPKSFEQLVYDGAAFRVQNTDLDIPVFVSTEAHVLSWLTLRAGARSYLYTSQHTKNTYNDEVVDTNSTYAADISFTTGFGITFKNWSLDAVVNPDSFESKLSSVQPGRGLLFSGDIVQATQADLRYRF